MENRIEFNQAATEKPISFLTEESSCQECGMILLQSQWEHRVKCSKYPRCSECGEVDTELGHKNGCSMPARCNKCKHVKKGSYFDHYTHCPNYPRCQICAFPREKYFENHATFCSYYSE